VRICLSERETALPEAGDDHVELLRPEHQLDGLRERRLVLDQQDPHWLEAPIKPQRSGKQR
jgi:hypothetical protein